MNTESAGPSRPAGVEELFRPHVDAGCDVEPEYVRAGDGAELLLVRITPRDNAGTIVFLPGMVSPVDTWSGALRALSSRYRILYVESREKPSSLVPPGAEFSLERYSRDLREVLAHVGAAADGAVLLASSFGGSIALQYASEPEPGIGSLVLVGPCATSPIPRWAIFWLTVLPIPVMSVFRWTVRVYIRLFQVDRSRDPEQAAKYSSNVDQVEFHKLKPTAKRFLRFDAFSFADRVRLRTLVVGAEADRMHRSDDLRRLVERLPDAEYVVLPTNRETHSERLLPLVRDFIERRGT